MGAKTLMERAAQLPTRPGVYLFRGSNEEVLYVGKANNLRVRVKQYLLGQDTRPMVPLLLRDARDVDVVLVDTEKEALLLENTLIKAHQPRYNVRLKDDKNFLHLRIRRADPWPRFTLVRRIQSDGARYFGPLHSATAARKTLATLQRTFPLRSCSDAILKNRSRPCLLHQMHRCDAPCVRLVERETYLQVVDEACLFLAGRTVEVVERLTARMTVAAEGERFEEAARLRDLIRAIRTTVERQAVVDGKLGHRDVWGVYREGERGVAAVLPVRGGMLGEPTAMGFSHAGEEDDALLSALVLRHYDLPPELAAEAIPEEVLLPHAASGEDALAEILSERRGQRVRVLVPQRGEKRHVVLLALQNARERFQQSTDEGERARRGLESLARICRLSKLPHRMECFDNSNLQGEDPVASMVVFIAGRPERKEYRRYRVKTVEGADDYATMREILGRRFRREGPRPDLVVVDGGHGQVNAVCQVLDELGISGQPVIGLSKPRTERRKGDRQASDKIVLPEVKDPIRLRPTDPALRVLQQLRDESHRYAVQYHRKLRSQRNLASVVEELAGVGRARRIRLLTHFGSARRLAEASAVEIAAVPGIGPALAARIHAAFHPGAGEE